MQFVPEPYQRTIIDHLMSHDEAALFCGMSLGKTASTLYAINEKLTDFAIDGVLVVAPLRVCNIVWPMEIKKWDQFRWLKVANLRTPEGRKMLKEGTAQVYLINFEMLQQFARDYLSKTKSTPFNAVVWDETTKAKNHTSKRINAVRKKLRGFCNIHWGLTGTPASNSYLDLFAQIRLLDGGKIFSPSYHHFRNTYFRPTDYMEYNWDLKDGMEDVIHEKLQDFALSMKTSDYLDLPDMIVEDIELKMDGKFKKLYKTMETDFLVQMESGEDLVAINSAVLVGKLLQFTSGAVYTEEGQVEMIHHKKIEAIKKLLKRTGNTLIVYNYIHERNRLKDSIPGAVCFSNAKTARDQQILCDNWNKGRIKTLLVHPKSMSHGLNLQGGGSDIIWASLTYSREDYDQLNARLVRRGQENITRVYRIIFQSTIDYAITEVLRSKGNRQDVLLKALKTSNP